MLLLLLFWLLLLLFNYITTTTTATTFSSATTTTSTTVIPYQQISNPMPTSHSALCATTDLVNLNPEESEQKRCHQELQGNKQIDCCWERQVVGCSSFAEPASIFRHLARHYVLVLVFVFVCLALCPTAWICVCLSGIMSYSLCLCLFQDLLLYL